MAAAFASGVGAVKLWPYLITLATAGGLQAYGLAVQVGIFAQELGSPSTTSAVIQTGSLATVLGTLVLFAQQIFSGRLVHRDVAAATADLTKALERSTAAHERSNVLYQESLAREARWAEFTEKLLAQSRHDQSRDRDRDR